MIDADYNAGDMSEFDSIAHCHVCGCAIFSSDEELNLMYWVKDADYDTTGHRIPYCRDCADAGVANELG